MASGAITELVILHKLSSIKGQRRSTVVEDFVLEHNFLIKFIEAAKNMLYFAFE